MQHSYRSLSISAYKATKKKNMYIRMLLNGTPVISIYCMST